MRGYREGREEPGGDVFLTLNVRKTLLERERDGLSHHMCGWRIGSAPCADVGGHR